MSKKDEEYIASLKETISLSIDAHDILRDQLTKVEREVKRLTNENGKLKKKINNLEKSSDEKINDT